MQSKYELIALSNWFGRVQNNRLKKAKIDKFFKEVYTPEEFLAKPNKESYYTACEDCNKSECLMIGDNIINDVYGAIDAGLNSVYYNRKSSNPEKNEYTGKFKIITSLSQLKEIL